MLEVRNGVLLGSMGDALATITRVASITKVYSITHILSIANHPLDWSLVRSEPEAKSRNYTNGDLEPIADGSDGKTREGGESGEVEKSEDVRDVEVGGVKKEAHCGFETMFVCLPDIPSGDLLHHFEGTCRFIREAVDQRGTVLVHW